MNPSLYQPKEPIRRSTIINREDVLKEVKSSYDVRHIATAFERLARRESLALELQIAEVACSMMEPGKRYTLNIELDREDYNYLSGGGGAVLTATAMVYEHLRKVEVKEADDDAPAGTTVTRKQLQEGIKNTKKLLSTTEENDDAPEV